MNAPCMCPLSEDVEAMAVVCVHTLVIVGGGVSNTREADEYHVYYSSIPSNETLMQRFCSTRSRGDMGAQYRPYGATA